MKKTTALKTKTEALTASVDQGAVLARVKEIEKDLHGVLEIIEIDTANEAIIADAADYTAVATNLIDVVRKRKYVDEQLDLFMEDVRKLEARVLGWFEKSRGDVARAESFFRSAMEAYALKLDNHATSLREAAARVDNEDKAAELHEEALACIPPKIPGISIRTKGRVVITSEEKLPKDCWKKVVDTKEVEARLMRGERVPGALVQIEKAVTVTTKNAKEGTERGGAQ